MGGRVTKLNQSNLVWSATLAAVETVDDTLLYPIPRARPGSSPCRSKTRFLFFEDKEHVYFGENTEATSRLLLKGSAKLSGDGTTKEGVMFFLSFVVLR